MLEWTCLLLQQGIWKVSSCSGVVMSQGMASWQERWPACDCSGDSARLPAHLPGLFSTMSLTPGSGDIFLQQMNIGGCLKIPVVCPLFDAVSSGPTVYIFLLTALSLTVLDRLQTLVASTVSFGRLDRQPEHKLAPKPAHSHRGFCREFNPYKIPIYIYIYVFPHSIRY